uniref:Uncharacterized protein n=1 Tax=Oryza nivara TaxID=4536 RepID=A0A0E0G1R2_ORYNI
MMMQWLARQAAARVVTQHARSGSGSGLAGAVRGYNNVSRRTQLLLVVPVVQPTNRRQGRWRRRHRGSGK